MLLVFFFLLWTGKIVFFYVFHRSGETASNSLASDVKRLCTLLRRSTRGLAYSIAAVG
ncbi:MULTISPECIES: hypothetical protein [Sinorhizobium]|uniref:hypothetical protein n=1 Tax=Sinorhizobium TaxID=28105 RepID=UPI001F454DD3|nr:MULTISPECIES: hypothetical protein [Sinorhizobium]WQO62128.1 hypothetical protein U8C35_28725 [Sinorhizobium medicae]